MDSGKAGRIMLSDFLDTFIILHVNKWQPLALENRMTAQWISIIKKWTFWYFL